MRRISRFAIATVSLLSAPMAATAAPFDFLAAPQTDLNRVYRIDRFSGEVTACQYGLKEGTIGVTLCYGAGEGAVTQPAGEYALIASRHEREGGVFRVNHRTGDMSVCYVFNDHVVCTPQAKAGIVQAGQAPAATTSPETTGSISAPKRN
ncbi:MAG: hypothetical protein ACRCTD_16495 [Beijerinckiaceae bacterium]